MGVQLKDRLDSSGNSVEVSVAGYTTGYSFEDKGLTLSSTDPVGTTTTYANDSTGNTLSEQYHLHVNIGLPSASVVTVTTHKTYYANIDLTDTVSHPFLRRKADELSIFHN